MRIALRSGRRHWICTGRYLSPSCGFERAIADDERLPTEIIAKASVQGRDSGDQLAKEQALYRRSARSLENVSEASAYLSNGERDTLRQAALILRRLGDAAEVAKRKKKQWEKVLQEQAARRRSAALRALTARYLDAKLSAVDSYLVLGALADRNDGEPLFSRDRLQAVFDLSRAKPEPFKQVLQRELDYALRQEIAAEAQFIGYGEADIAVALARFFEDIDGRLPRVRERSADMIRAIETLLAMADNPKIVPLRR